MSDFTRLAGVFRSLHVPGRPLVLYNVWDAGSARVVAAAGAAALATGSWSVAAAHGCEDGERLPLELAMANLRRIVGATGLPVSVDLESGYGAHPADVARTVDNAIECGAIGCNLEDSLPHDGSLRDSNAQVERLRAARAAAQARGLDFFINARTDVFFQAPPERHDESLLEAAVERARAYAAAGADGLFVPGLADRRLIEQLVRVAPLPVNIMSGPKTPPLAELAALGVARVSYGPGPWRVAMDALEQAARAAFAQAPQQ